MSLRKGSKVVKAKAPAPTVDELTKQVSLLKKQLGEVQLEAVRCHELELGASALQQEVVSLREELARSEARGREERKEHCSAQVEQLLQLVLVRAELQAAETQASAERAANCQARRVAKHKHPLPLSLSSSASPDSQRPLRALRQAREELRLLSLAHAEAHQEAAALQVRVRVRVRVRVG